MTIYRQIFWVIILVFIQFLTLEGYNLLNIEDDDLCSLFKKRTIKLSSGSQSGIIVSHSRLNDHFLKWEHNLDCAFVINSSGFDGVFAVIQHLNFRQNPYTGECIDYVQFSAKYGAQSRKFCGEIGVTAPETNSFITQAALQIKIFVAKQPLQLGEKMDLKIAVTGYGHCLQRDSDNMESCGKNSPFCIDRNFINDGIVNCAFEFCLDEEGCPPYVSKIDDPEVPFTTKLLIGSSTCLVVLFLSFIIFIWICKKHNMFCWSQRFAHPSTASEQQQPVRVIEMNERTGSRLSQHGINGASAPPCELELDKDLPPTYESLFSTK